MPVPPGWKTAAGRPLADGGKHARMGTHNRLLGLGELLPRTDRDRSAGAAAGPAALVRARPPADLPADRPRLIHWVARSDDIGPKRRQRRRPGEILPMERGDYRWRITVPADGHLPGERPGADPDPVGCPASIPRGRLPDAGCRLMKLEGFHPQPARIGNALPRSGFRRDSTCIAALPDEPRNWWPTCERLAGLKSNSIRRSWLSRRSRRPVARCVPASCRRRSSPSARR
jgi:hypothetical protein